MSSLRKKRLRFYWSQTAASLSVPATGSVNLSAYVVNPYSLTLTYSALDSLPSGMTLTGSTLISSGAAGGQNTVRFRVTDGTDNADISSTLSVVVNSAPVWSGSNPTALPGTYYTGQTYQVSVASYASDPDGDTLTYALTSHTFTTASINASTGVLTFQAANAGSYSATVTISDGKASPVSRTFSASIASSVGELPAYGWLVTASNVGLARLGINGANLPLYTGPSTIPAGTTISDRRITLDTIRCHLGNITFERCLFKPTAANGSDGYIFGYINAAGNQAGNLIIRDCDIDGSSIPAGAALWAQCAIRATGTFQRCRIWGFGSGLAIFGSSAVPVALVEHMHIQGLRDGGESHNEAATIRGFSGTSLIVRKNWFWTDVERSSGAMFIQPYTDDIRNVWLEDNYYNAPTNYDLYIENSFGNTCSNVNVTNGRFVMAGLGITTQNGASFATWTNNYRYVNSPPNYAGAAVSP